LFVFYIIESQSGLSQTSIKEQTRTGTFIPAYGYTPDMKKSCRLFFDYVKMSRAMRSTAKSRAETGLNGCSRAPLAKAGCYQDESVSALPFARPYSVCCAALRVPTAQNRRPPPPWLTPLCTAFPNSMRAMTSRSSGDLTGLSLPVTLDRKGRVRASMEQRQMIIVE
jgi:hypothetical protein